MVRLLLSIVIITIIITFLILPFMKTIRRGLTKTGERVDEAFSETYGEGKNNPSTKMTENEERKYE